ncbi:MAG: Hsp70 family protein [Armatimonadetes bacterium]|nr:Hsp70 family protein [Armatimonadota bacterium]
MGRFWAFDLGTTNSALAVWNEERAEPEMVALPEISRETILTETPILPSCVFLYHGQTWGDRLGRLPAIERRWLLGRQAYIGNVALEMNYDGRSPNYVESFKPMLARESTRVMSRVDGRAFNARGIARIFLREALRAVQEHRHERIRDLTVTVPVDSFETYRAELREIAGQLGIRRFQTLDEPVAAALGYGLNTEREMTLLVMDFGGGTLDLAVVRTTGPGEAGTPAEVIAKQGLELGGNNVDVWLLEHFARSLGIEPRIWRGTEWYQALLDEAQRLKEQLYAQEKATLMLSDRIMVELGLRGKERPTLSREGLVELLASSGLYRDLELALERLLHEVAAKGIGKEDIDEVLICGGSSLLPEVHAVFEREFGRPRLRDWLPFEAVAYGACVFAAGHKVQDYIRHDYALLTFDRETKKQEYPVIIPRGTIYPTAGAIWEDYFTPTCPRGEPANEFELRIFELGRAATAQREIGYDENGRLRVLERGDSLPNTICLNETDPTLGRLRPPHPPERRDARLKISFGINGDRYLTATVHDLLASQLLMDNQPVVKLR